MSQIVRIITSTMMRAAVYRTVRRLGPAGTLAIGVIGAVGFYLSQR